MAFGVVVANLDEIPDALARHRLVIRRGRPVSLAEQVDLTTRLGTIVGADAGVPQVRYEDDRQMHPDQAYFNEQWHADVSWSAEGPVITVLCALRAGRDATPTSFLDTVSALARVPDDVRDDAASWTCRHHIERSRHLRHGRGSPTLGGSRRRRPDPPGVAAASVPTYVDDPGAAHPVIVTDRSSGRAGATLGDHAWTVDGMSEGDGAARVDVLQRWLVDLGDRHTHQWRRGDVVVFDNRTVLHRREPRRRATRRRLLRRTIAWPSA
jgi:alpha-ketoglutarate-dependent taurine dioxygenase